MKLTKILFLFIMAVLLTGCGKKSYLNTLVEELNELCPYTIMEGTVLQRIEMHDQTAVFFIDENQVPESKSELREGALYYFATADDYYIKGIVSAIINEYANLGLSYKDDNDRIYKIEYTAYELESLRTELGISDDDALAAEEAEEAVDSIADFAEDYDYSDFSIDDDEYDF